MNAIGEREWLKINRVHMQLKSKKTNFASPFLKLTLSAQRKPIVEVDFRLVRVLLLDADINRRDSIQSALSGSWPLSNAKTVSPTP